MKKETTDINTSLINAVKTFLVFFLCILFWEIYLFGQIKGSHQSASVWTVLFACAESIFLTLLCGWSRKRSVNNAIQIILLLLIWFYYLSQLIYHRLFGSFYSVSMIGMAGNAINNFSWTLLSAVRSAVGLIIGSLIPVILFIFYLLIFKPDNHYDVKGHAVSLLLSVIVWAVAVLALPLAGISESSAYAAYHSDYIDTDTASSRIGILTNALIDTKSLIIGSEKTLPEFTDDPEITEPDNDPNNTALEVPRNVLEQIDFKTLASKAEDSDHKSLSNYLKTITGSNKNDYTGLFEGYNLIYICGEAFSSYALDENVTPTLYKLAHEGIVLNNYYNSFKNVTTNGEYAFLTGLWPDLSAGIYAGDGTTIGSFPQSADNLMPLGMGTMFNEQCGTVSRAYHNYYGFYYGRNQYLPNIGFTCKFMNEGMYFSSFWPSSDYEMMLQSVDDYINDDQFCVYYMTFSGHGEYNWTNVIYNKNIYTVYSLYEGPALTDEAMGYLACNYELELAMQYLLNRLEEAGKLENTVIVLAGDHTPYSLSEYGVNSIAGHEVDYDFEIYKNTCIIWNGGLKEPVYVDEPCCNMDIYPTILNLFGLDFDSRLMAGRDIFSDSEHAAVIYNKSFITSEVKYNAVTGTAEWAEGNSWSNTEREQYLTKYINLIKNRYTMSVKIESSDYYRFVWENTDW